MRADLLQQLQYAATSAQAVAGEAFTISGDPAGPYAGTFGPPQLDVDGTIGGVRQRVVIPLTITRTQFASAPKRAATLTRSSTGQRYTIDAVNTHDALHYMLILVEVAGGK